MDGLSFCRGCLSRHDEPDDLIQYTEKNRRLFVYSTGLQVKINDVFMFQLCKECYNNMKMGCKFKKQCRASDKRFKKYIGLKEAGATDDLATFLVKDDDMFGYPFISGGITPSYQHAKEDDNESTNTSICNFMTGLVQPGDLLNAEAKIVSEVIAEEADILEDSLDSLWLQDDLSMDPELNMDNSLSAFSTPRVSNEERGLTPRKIDELNAVTPMNIEVSTEQQFKFASKYLPNVYAALEAEAATKGPKSIPNLAIAPRKTLKSMPDLDSIITGPNEPKFMLGTKIVQLEESMVVDKDIPKDSIDKNLKKALNDENADAFSLSELLVSPAHTEILHASPSISIKRILFGNDPVEDEVTKNLPTTEQAYWPKPLPNILFIQDAITTTAGACPNILDDILEEASANLEVEPLKLNFYVDTHQQEIGSSGQIDPRGRVITKLSKVCNVCCLTFESVRKKREHCREVHPTVQCNQCNKKFSDKSNYKRHLLTHEKKTEWHNFICDLCQRIFSSKAKLLQHLRTHPPFRNLPQESFARFPDQVHKERVCPTCNITIKGQNYYTHIRRHNNSLHTHQCALCDKGFHRRTELNNHMETIHRTETNTHPCHKCERIFSSTHSLNRHIRLTHTDDVDKPFKCEKCNSEFAGRNELRDHMVSSHGVARRKKAARIKIFKCAHCDRMFSSLKEVEIHVTQSRRCIRIRAKMNQKEFKCEFCDSKFPKKSDLNIHLRNAEKCLALRNIGIKSEMNCKFCEKFQGGGVLLKKHAVSCLRSVQITAKTDSGYECRFCSKVYEKFQLLVRHMKSSTICLRSRGKQGVEICTDLTDSNVI